MARHSDGRRNWKISDIVKQVLRMQLLWGGLGLLTVAVIIVVLETTALGGR